MDKFLVGTINILRKLLQSHLNEVFKDYNLTSSEIFFIYILNDENSLSQIEISKVLECNKSHIHRVLTKLIDKGYVEYQNKDSEHFKNQKLTLTKKGKSLVCLIEKAVDEWNYYLKKGLTEDELNIAKKVALKIVENANNFKNMENKNV